MTPHFHHNEMSEEQHHEEHEESDNLLDWLSLSFHNDAGAGHLECYSDLDYPDFDVNYCWLPLGDLAQRATVFLQTIDVEEKTLDFVPNHFQFREKLLSAFYLSDAPLRAPPFCA